MAEEKKYVMFDPGVGAYREMNAETAKKFVESAEKVKAALAKDGAE